MLINENSNTVREEAFCMLREIKRLTGLTAQNHIGLEVDMKVERIDEIISKLPKVSVSG